MSEKSKKGSKAYKTGKQLENRVARWLKRQGYTCWKGINARGKVVSRPYDVDVYATKGWLSKHHIWVECKTYKIKRSHVTKLVESVEMLKTFMRNIPMFRRGHLTC